MTHSINIICVNDENLFIRNKFILSEVVKVGISCKIFGHKWDWCKCLKCGEFRNEQHEWNGCKCTKCGRTRLEQHEWNGCICTKCGSKRNEQHKFNAYCKCSRCGKEEHNWNKCKCLRCGKEDHTWTYTRGYDGKPLITNKPCSRCGEFYYSEAQRMGNSSISD